MVINDFLKFYSLLHNLGLMIKVTIEAKSNINIHIIQANGFVQEKGSNWIAEAHYVHWG